MSSKKIVFEAPVYTMEAALKACKYGVDRLELCADYCEGGTTPSPGMFEVIKKNVDIPLFVMIRPRGAGFMYSSYELEAMKADIQHFYKQGADGFVFGILDKEGKVDEKACQALRMAAGEKPCTFHRAFDTIKNQEEALETIVRLGFKRILTSGGKNTVGEGLDKLVKLLDLAQNRIIVVPGGGTKAGHLQTLNRNQQLKEIHASCKMTRSLDSGQRQVGVKLSLLPEMEGKLLTVDKEKIQEIKSAISNLI
jgi:copper homeostasis protein